MSNISRGYDDEPAGGVFLRLKKKGDRVILRLVDGPIGYDDTYTDKETQETTVNRKYAWIALHKEKTGTRAVIFVNGPSVYKAVRALVSDENWGDPSGYDIQVERTEESKAKYYSVIPIPRGMGPITKEEAAIIAEAELNLEMALPKGTVPAATASQVKPQPVDDEDDIFAEE